MEILVMRNGHPMWERTAAFARQCSWRAGPVLARRMEENAFNGMERVIIAVQDGRIAGFCTLSEKDELPEKYDHTPFIGFVFVDEAYRGRRLSGQMIGAACRLAGEMGYPSVYVMSGEKGLYEIYGFRYIGEFETVYGTRDGLYQRLLRPGLLSGTCNTRDLGGLPAAAGIFTLPDRVWRSDAPVKWDDGDARLMRERGITTVIDLRTEAERQKTPCTFDGAEGFDYRPVPITAGSVPPSSLEAVPSSYMEIAMSPGTARALRWTAEAEGGVLVSCTAGKDRTGVVSAILLLACGAEREAIVRDYALSREYNRVRLEKYLSEHPETDRRTVTANEGSMEAFLSLFLDRFGSAEGFFDRAGLADCLEGIRRKLLC